MPRPIGWEEHLKRCFSQVVNRSCLSHDKFGVHILTSDSTTPLYADEFVLRQFPCLNNALCSSAERSGIHLDLSKHEEKVVLELLRFVYLGETEDLTTEITLSEQLVKLAKELDFQLLLQSCGEWLESGRITIDTASVIRILDLAVSTRAEKITKQCMRFLFYHETLLKAGVSEWLEKKKIDHLKAVFLHAIGYDDSNHLNILPPHDYPSFSKTSRDMTMEVLSGNENVLYNDINVCVSYPGECEMTYHCHRIFLGNSRVLRRMMDGQFSEMNCSSADPPTLRITDVPVAVMSEVLYFLYQQDVLSDLSRNIIPHIGVSIPTWDSSIEDLVEDVCLAEVVIRKAHEYELTELVHLCENTLNDLRLTVNNVLRILGIARLYDLQRVQRRCLWFFHYNRSLVLRSETFLQSIASDSQTLQFAAASAAKFYSCSNSESQYVIPVHFYCTSGVRIYESSVSIRSVNWKIALEMHKARDCYYAKAIVEADTGVHSDCTISANVRMRLVNLKNTEEVAPQNPKHGHNSLVHSLCRTGESNRAVVRFENPFFVNWEYLLPNDNYVYNRNGRVKFEAIIDLKKEID